MNLNNIMKSNEIEIPAPILSFGSITHRLDLNYLVEWIIGFPDDTVSLSDNKLLKKGENMLLGAVLFYLWNVAPENEQTIGAAQVLLSELQADIAAKNSISAVDILFDDWSAGRRNLLAVYDWEDIRALDSNIQLEIITRLLKRIEAIKKFI